MRRRRTRLAKQKIVVYARKLIFFEEILVEEIVFLGQAGLKRTAEHRKARFLQYSEDFLRAKS